LNPPLLSATLKEELDGWESGAEMSNPEEKKAMDSSNSSIESPEPPLFNDLREMDPERLKRNFAIADEIVAMQTARAALMKAGFDMTLPEAPPPGNKKP